MIHHLPTLVVNFLGCDVNGGKKGQNSSIRLRSTDYLPCTQVPQGRLGRIGFSIDVNVLQRTIKKTAGNIARDAVAHVLIFQIP